MVQRVVRGVPSGSSIHGQRTDKRNKDDSRIIYIYIYIYLLGFGSVRSEDKDSIILNSDKAGDQFCFRMSMQMFPCSEICIRLFKS